MTSGLDKCGHCGHERARHHSGRCYAEAGCLCAQFVEISGKTTPPSPEQVAGKLATTLGRLVGASLPKGWGFVLLLAQSGGGQAGGYSSSFEPKDAAPIVREFARALEESEEPEPDPEAE